ncbi:TolB domain-containing protein [Priestia megaterium]|uniref:TolB family protein n=1 Tax=Priestia megaterium TaxID=1404 RepID=UPI0026E3095E|nr:TolB domain-containing protein [Priestia megaterium]MDO6847582.1 TolB domain-containing protein [Priestia megaterium]
MVKKIALCLLFLMLFPMQINAANTVKVSFIRQGNLWVYDNGTERQLSYARHASMPQWSSHGDIVAYAENDSLMIAPLKGKPLLVEHDVTHYQWSPLAEELAYISNGILVYYNVKTHEKKRVAVGVDQFSWFPEGDRFLIASAAALAPTGWGPVKLYTVSKYAGLDVKKVEAFTTLPAENDSFFAYTTSSFKWSPNGQWISFIAIPTASMSADANKLCIITKEGKAFQVVGDMLNVPNWFKWSNEEQVLAFINGEGRFATENKKFTLKEMPVFKEHVFTPKGFADWDFTWTEKDNIIISRVPEAGWSNDEKKRPLPFLYSMNVKTNKQSQFTFPQKGLGDYAPVYHKATNQTMWIRTNRKQANLLTRVKDTKNDKVLISGLDLPGNYYELYRWNEVFSVYSP